jgi:hypothetical protein
VLALMVGMCGHKMNPVQELKMLIGLGQAQTAKDRLGHGSI